MDEPQIKVVKLALFESSPRALAMCNAEHVGTGVRDEDEQNAKYPFKSMLVGESFAVRFDTTQIGTLQSLRSSCSAYGKKLGRKFRVLVHPDLACIEVARIA